MTRILGIDPGLADTGYGIIDSSGTGYVHITHGIIRTTPQQTAGERLAAIYSEIIQLVSRYQPDAAAVECLYFARNTSSAFPVAQARGVVLLALQQHNIVAAEYSPQAIKQALVGYGRAEKHQVQHMVRAVLGLAAIPKPDHAADALAAAVCHANTAAFQDKAAGGRYTQ